jgi:hypothetical protein
MARLGDPDGCPVEARGAHPGAPLAVGGAAPAPGDRCVWPPGSLPEGSGPVGGGGVHQRVSGTRGGEGLDHHAVGTA